MKLAREQWKQSKALADPAHLVFLDEAGAKTNMTRLRGRAKGGRRCIDDTPHGHWCATTMISSVRLDGTTACMAIDDATSGEIFREYVRHVLVPTLRPGDVVIFDNLPAHRDAQAANLIRAAGATPLALPAYSPDLNPIEKMWSKVKEFLRQAKARTFDALLDAIGAALKTVTAQDATGWFQSCGYATSQS